MLTRLNSQVRRFAGRVVDRVENKVRDWTRPRESVFLGAASDLVRPKTELVVENALLRQQLMVLRRQVGRVRLTPVDRVRLVLLARVSKSWADALLIFQPRTILRWHRRGFRLFWRRKSPSRHRRGSLPRSSA